MNTTKNALISTMKLAYLTLAMTVLFQLKVYAQQPYWQATGTSNPSIGPDGVTGANNMLGTPAGINLRFGTNGGTERMRITENGNVGIGITTFPNAGIGLHVQSPMSSTFTTSGWNPNYHNKIFQ